MREQELADLKAELEMPSLEEVQELRKQLETLQVKHNELVDWLTHTFKKEDRAYMTQFLKVKETET